MSITGAALTGTPFCLAYTVSGTSYALPSRVYNVSFQASGSPHNAELWLDGAKLTNAVWLASGASQTLRVAVPNDGFTHKLRVVDPGNLGTPAAQSSEITIPSTTACTGVVYVTVSGVTENTETKQKYVNVRLQNTGTISQTFTCRNLLDGKVIHSAINLTPGQISNWVVYVPPDNAVHSVSTEVKLGSAFADDVVLWYTLQGNPPPPPPPDPGAGATDFIPGQTVIIQSAVGSTPLATDGSEWVRLEIAPKNSNSWVPAGPDGGLIMPQDDGTWSSTIFTNPVNYPVGSEWVVRSRRYRDYVESAISTHPFKMIAGTTPTPPVDGGGNPLPSLSAPVITGPINRRQAGGTWLKINGTGVPGDRLEFKTEVVSSWGQGDYTPNAATVGSNGKWETMVFAKKQKDPHEYKVLGYRARALRNNQFSQWSNRLDVTWYHAPK